MVTRRQRRIQRWCGQGSALGKRWRTRSKRRLRLFLVRCRRTRFTTSGHVEEEEEVGEEGEDEGMERTDGYQWDKRVVILLWYSWLYFRDIISMSQFSPDR